MIILRRTPRFNTSWVLVLVIIASIVMPLRTFALGTGRLVASSNDGNLLKLDYQNARVEIVFLEGGIVRVDVSAAGLAVAPESLLTTKNGPRPMTFQPQPTRLRAGTESLAVEYTRDAFGLRVAGPADETLLKISEDGVVWATDGKYAISFAKQIGDKFLGMGEPLPDQLVGVVELNQNGSVRPIWTRHVPPADLGIPFYFNPRGGYGLFVDNPWKAEFNFKATDTFTYKAAGGPLRFYLIFGPDIATILDRYTSLTGRPPIPPRWVTGYLQSQYGYINEKDFRGLMDNFRSRKIPADTLIFDLDWFGGSDRMGDLWWGDENFPDGPSFMKELDSRGFKAITIVEPYVFQTSRNFELLKKDKMLTQGPDGAPLVFPFWGRKPAGLMDFTNPDTQQWFGDQVARIHDSGVDAWWTDLNEPETDPDGNNYQAGPREAWHNLQAFLMNKAIFDMYQNKYPDERLFIMTRSGFSGIQRFGSGVWSGDVNATFHHLENQIPIALSSGLSGLPVWNSDVGGFHGKPSPELYVRWLQFGAFCPVFRPHGNHDRREPWMFGEEAEQINKKYIDLRYRLSPYLYTLFKQMHDTGAPVMRPTFFEFPGDANSWKMETQFLYGPWLLVAPVTRAGADKVRAYLPAGHWTYFWDERVVDGPRGISVPVDLATLPLFVREGAILPMGPVMQYTGETPVDPLEIHYYPSDQPTAFSLYEDDGATNAYLRGEFAQTVIRGYKQASSMSLIVEAPKGTFQGMPESRAYRVVFHHAETPKIVALDGKNLDAGNWTYDAQIRQLTVNAPTVRGGFQVDILF